MLLSPLILNNYFVTNLSVKATLPEFPSPQEALQAVEGSGANISTKVELGKNNNDPLNWRVVLQVSCKPMENRFCLYSVDLELIGFFTIHKDIDKSKVGDLVAANGPALLYGAARELLLLITSRGPTAPFILPSATFVDLCPSNRKQQEQSSPETSAIVA
jgi:preprotein translocase subunit SecB